MKRCQLCLEKVKLHTNISQTTDKNYWHLCFSGDEEYIYTFEDITGDCYSFVTKKVYEAEE